MVAPMARKHPRPRCYPSDNQHVVRLLSYERFVSREYAKDVCDKFLQLGVRGVSVLFPNGDNDVGEGNCETQDSSVQFIPEFTACVAFLLCLKALHWHGYAHYTATLSQVR
jgi:hypothetical protein